MADRAEGELFNCLLEFVEACRVDRGERDLFIKDIGALSINLLAATDKVGACVSHLSMALPRIDPDAGTDFDIGFTGSLDGDGFWDSLL